MQVSGQSSSSSEPGNVTDEELEVEMKSRIRIPVVLLAILLCFGAACTLLGGGNVAVDLMKKVPVDSTSFSYWAVGDIDADQELWEIFAIFNNSTEADQVMDTGLALSIVRHSAKASGFEGLTTNAAKVLTGEFDVNDTERRLEREQYTKSTYQEIGIWTPPEGLGFSPIAVQEGTFLIGDEESLKLCIDVKVKDDVSSLYDNPNVKLVVDKLPDGIIVNVWIATADSEEKYEDLVAYGRSYRKVEEGMLELTAVYMFQAGFSAGNAQDAIKDYLGTKKFNDIKVERDDSFIRATARIYVSDSVAFLVY